MFGATPVHRWDVVLIIRDETPADFDVIRAITTYAFAAVRHGSGTEAQIIDDLRATGGLTLSLVAIEDGDVVGHVAFSPATIAGELKGLYGLGPLSVRPDRQRRGVGGALVKAGLERLRGLRSSGCIVFGSPKYYGRFGFKIDSDRCPAGLPSQFFQTLAFGVSMPDGEIRYHPAFGITS